MSALLAIPAALAVASISLIASALVALKMGNQLRVISLLVAFAAGIFLGNVFFHLLPESIELNHGTGLTFACTLFGLMCFFLLDYFRHSNEVCETHDHDHELETTNLAPMNLIGDSVHNFVDGVVIAGSFILDPTVGVTVTLAIIAHELPQEMADTGVLLKGGLKPATAIKANFASGLTCVLGALLGLVWQTQLSQSIGLLFGFTAGAFLYIALSDLLPLMRHEKPVHAKGASLQLVCLTAGLLLMYGINAGHDHSAHDLHLHDRVAEFEQLLERAAN